METAKDICERMWKLACEREEKESKEQPNKLAIAKEGMAAEVEEAKQEVGFSARLLVQATLPHSKPKPEVFQFQRSNGFVTVRINGRMEYGLPYGIYPRLLLAWMTTEAVRTQSPELVLGKSLAEFMGKLELGKGTGGRHGSIARLRQHMQRLFTSTVSATIERDGEMQNIGFLPVERFSLFWDPQRPDQGTLWHSNLRLSQLFFDEIVYRPVPVDMAALRVLAKSKSPLAIDLYQWLTFRMSYLRQPLTIPWPALQLQFGISQKICERNFRREFTRRLKQVLELYPQAKAEPTKAGLKLWPSKTSVPMRLIKG
jgi:hypothetical protein